MRGFKRFKGNVKKVLSLIPLEEKRWVDSYSIDKERKEITVYYVDGHIEYVPLEDWTQEEIDEKISNSLAEIGDEAKKTKKLNRSFIAYSYGIATVVATMFVLAGLPPLGVFSYSYGVFSIVNIPYLRENLVANMMLKRLKMDKWVCEHSEETNQVIKEEVENVAQPKEVDATHLIPVPTSYIYPEGKTPYSQEMYEDGINLNNIAELQYNELKKIKKKVLKKSKY